MCVFCKIISGEIPSYKLYEDQEFLAILDISQATIGHTLVIPKKHISTIFDLDENTASNIFKVVTKIANKLKNAFDLEGMNILNNNGEVAGQSVDHFHVHLIPRYRNDQIVIQFSKNHLNQTEFIDLVNQIIKQ